MRDGLLEAYSGLSVVEREGPCKTSIKPDLGIRPSGGDGSGVSAEIEVCVVGRYRTCIF